jgi:glutamate synthase (NADPH/NADH) small chain
MSLKDVLTPFYAWKRAMEKPYTINKPITERPGAPRYRGFHVNEINECIGCGSCEEICQNEAIDMVPVEGRDAGKGDSGLRPRIDYGRCCWCALCVDVCPTGSLGMSNEYNWISPDADEFRFTPGVDIKNWNDETQGYRRTDEAWLLDPELIPMPVLEPEVRKNTFEEMALGYGDIMSEEEAARCLECGLCVEACPTHMDIPEYIRAVRENRLEDGLKILYDTNPFSESCGRICTAHCQDVCALSHNGEAIPIRWLKRYITDNTVDKRYEVLGIGNKLNKTGKKVAIVGGGPSGLTSAFYLRQYGHNVTVFEKHSEMGGMLRFGIPEYRLPKAVLDREMQVILDTGVAVKKNTTIGKDITLKELSKKYDAVYLSVGAQLGTGMPIEGMDAEGVEIGVDFLERIADGDRPDLGKRVIVVGGGNTAMDVCRSSVRLGAKEVIVLYRRTEQEMPANHEEIEEAKEEGVDIRLLATPIKITREGGKLVIEVQKMKLGEPDASGRRRPVPIEGSEYNIEADTCIMAIGQKVDGLMGEAAEVKVTRWGTFEVDTKTLATNVPGIFAGGDCQTGPDDAIKAIADGKKAAVTINRYLIDNSK